MDRILRESLRLLNAALGDPGDFTRLLMLLVLASAVLLLSMRKMGEVLRVPEPDKGVVAIFLVSLVLMLFLGGVYRVHLAAQVPDPQFRRYIPLVIAAAVFLLVSLPAVCLIQRATVISGLIAMVTSLVVTWLVVLAASAVINAWWAGKRELDKSDGRAESFSDFFLD